MVDRRLEDLIEKLEAVTVARGATPAEAAVAAKKVRELHSSNFFTLYGEEAVPRKGRPRDSRPWVDRVVSYRTN